MLGYFYFNSHLQTYFVFHSQLQAETKTGNADLT